MHCGERLRMLRRNKGFTVRSLASETGLYFTAISKIENGERKLTMEEAIRLAEVLGIDLYDLADIPSPCADLSESRLVKTKTLLSRCTQKSHEMANLLHEMDELLLHG